MGFRPRRGKYNNARTEFAGAIYDSKLEAKLAQKLELMKKAIGPDRDRPVDVKRQQSIELVVNGSLICRYRCDFVITFADGHTEYWEAKGLETPEWKLKEKLFRALFPERRLVVVRAVR